MWPGPETHAHCTAAQLLGHVPVKTPQQAAGQRRVIGSPQEVQAATAALAMPPHVNEMAPHDSPVVVPGGSATKGVSTKKRSILERAVASAPPPDSGGGAGRGNAAKATKASQGAAVDEGPEQPPPAQSEEPCGETPCGAKTTSPQSRREQPTKRASAAVKGRARESKMEARLRTKYSAEQQEALERAYAQERQPGGDGYRRLGMAIGLEPARVQTWFQNRRAREKASKAMEAAAAAAASAAAERMPMAEAMAALEARVAQMASENAELREDNSVMHALLAKYAGGGVRAQSLLASAREQRAQIWQQNEAAAKSLASSMMASPGQPQTSAALKSVLLCASRSSAGEGHDGTAVGTPVARGAQTAGAPRAFFAERVSSAPPRVSMPAPMHPHTFDSPASPSAFELGLAERHKRNGSAGDVGTDGGSGGGHKRRSDDTIGGLGGNVRLKRTRSLGSGTAAAAAAEYARAVADGDERAVTPNALIRHASATLSSYGDAVAEEADPDAGAAELAMAGVSDRGPPQSPAFAGEPSTHITRKATVPASVRQDPLAMRTCDGTGGGGGGDADIDSNALFVGALAASFGMLDQALFDSTVRVQDHLCAADGCDGVDGASRDAVADPNSGGSGSGASCFDDATVVELDMPMSVSDLADAFSLSGYDVADSTVKEECCTDTAGATSLLACGPFNVFCPGGDEAQPTACDGVALDHCDARAKGKPGHKASGAEALATSPEPSPGSPLSRCKRGAALMPPLPSRSSARASCRVGARMSAPIRTFQRLRVARTHSGGSLQSGGERGRFESSSMPPLPAADDVSAGEPPARRRTSLHKTTKRGTPGALNGTVDAGSRLIGQQA